MNLTPLYDMDNIITGILPNASAEFWKNRTTHE